MTMSPVFLAAALFVSANAMAADRGDAELELAQAENAVQSAERDDAARYAPGDLNEAHAMLLTAHDAYDSRAWNDSARYAERAKLSGVLAGARSRQQRADIATTEIERSVSTLRAQLGLPGGTP